MRAWFARLPFPARVAVGLLLAAAAAALLAAGYEWLGRLILDNGGVMG